MALIALGGGVAKVGGALFGAPNTVADDGIATGDTTLSTEPAVDDGAVGSVPLDTAPVTTNNLPATVDDHSEGARRRRSGHWC